MIKHSLSLSLLLAAPAALVAQSSGSLRGQVLDPNGAVVTDATITVADRNGKQVQGKANKLGLYEVKDLAPGTYTVTAAAKGFAPYTAPEVEVTSAVKKFDIKLDIAVQEQQVSVDAEAPSVSVDPSSNASSTVLKGKDLDALSDDPDEFSQELSALAGPSAGPNGGQIYIDGFTGGQLPPKSAIREIRINQNPFSAEYDRPGYGRIEVFTKPGTDKFHGQAFINGNSSSFNSRNRFYPDAPGYDSQQYSGSLGGPLSKKASFFFNIERRNINEQSVSNPVTSIDVNGNPVFSPVTLDAPATRTNISPRLDYQVSANNTLNLRYGYEDSSNVNNLNGQYSLASQAFNSNNREHTFQIGDTQIFGAKIVNETRYRFQHEISNQKAVDPSTTINVLNAFVGGGNSLGASSDLENRHEFQNYTSIAEGNHFMRFGVRLRVNDRTLSSLSNFNGTYTFTSLANYNAGIPSQYSQTTGTPSVHDTFVDAGLYAEDDWKIRSNLTLSAGLRYETQSDIHDHADWAPRIGIAYGIGPHKSGPPKTILRLGWGIFYDRFTQDLVLNADRLNGVTQQNFIVQSPSYPTPPTLGAGNGVAAFTRYKVDPNLRAPYNMQTAVGLEHQLGRIGTISATYINTRGVHQLLTRNINAPLNGTFDPTIPNSGIRPYGNIGNIYQYQSEGVFRQNQLITNVNIRASQKVTLFGYYSLNFSNGNTAGAGSFPTNQYDLNSDYGRTAFDVRNRVFVGGSISLPWYFRVSPFITAQSGQPFNIILGHDINGDSIFNDRPGPAASGGQNVATKYGVFNVQPTPGGAVIAPYIASGSPLFTFNLRLAKTFGIGPKLHKDNAQTADGGQGGPRGGPGGPGGPGGGGPRGGGGNVGFGGGRGGPGGMFGAASTDTRYNLTFSVQARNLFNNTNYAPPNGNLSSPNFGISTALAGGPFGSQLSQRRIDLQLMFSF